MIHINKKGQAWGIDLIIGIMIFSVGILFFFIYTINYSGESKESLEKLSYKGDVLLSNILSAGYPENWDINNVVKIGILSNDRINETKLEGFYNLANNNYPKTKSLFKTEYNYYFFFDNMSVNSVPIQGIGKPETDINNMNASNLIKITRFTIYKEKPTNVYLYIWED